MIDISILKASEIARIINGELYGEDVEINKISIDSRENLDKNTCFWGIKGKKFDGNEFTLEAENKKAGLIVSNKRTIEGSHIYVRDTRIALELLAKSRIKNTKIVALTGSVGKTTVKNMIISVLSQKYITCGTQGNQNNEIGVLLTLLKIKNEDFCVVEMGMRNRGEIDYLASVAKPETVIITNALTSHIERLKSKNNIFLAKCEILNYSPKNAILPFEKRFVNLNIDNMNLYYVGENSSCRIGNFRQNNNEIVYEIIDEENIKTMKIYSLFLHNIQNSLFAYKVGRIYGLTDEEIREGLLNYKQDKYREEYKRIDGITIINDSYNASYESMASALCSLKKYCIQTNKTPCALLGDILELGKCSQEIHEKIARLCKELGIKKLFYKGENYKIFKKHLENTILIDASRESFRYIKQYLNSDDVLLVKGSRNMNLEKILVN